MVRIGRIELQEEAICLAPMAGRSTLPFRVMCHEMGSSFAPTVLISARSICYNGLTKSMCYLNIDKSLEGITSIQLFGYEPLDFYKATKLILEDERLRSVDIIDINMGCPVKKVIKTGAGGALLLDVDRATRIASTVLDVASSYGKEVSVKTRLSYSGDINEGIMLCKALSREGVSLLTIHGRTTEQAYRGSADYEGIRRIRESLGDEITLFANGDIVDYESYLNALTVTKAEGVMIGRAAVGNPWVFKNIRRAIKGEDFFVPSRIELCECLLRELKGLAEYIGEECAVKEMRSVMPSYIKGYHNATNFKVRLLKALSIEEIEGILEEFKR